MKRPKEFDFSPEVKENIEMLKKSRDFYGEFYEILEDADGNIIDGHHRLAAGFKRRRRLENVRTELDRILVRMNANSRREVTESETRRQIVRIAELLIKELGITKNEVGAYLFKMSKDEGDGRITYSGRHIRRLLPDEYKQTVLSPVPTAEKVKAEKTPAQVLTNEGEAVLSSVSNHTVESVDIRPQTPQLAITPAGDEQISRPAERSKEVKQMQRFTFFRRLGPNEIKVEVSIKSFCFILENDIDVELRPVKP